MTNGPQRRLRRGVAVTMLIVVAFAGTAGRALATGTLDQQNPGPANSFAGVCDSRLAQTFTAGLTGTLDTLELQLHRDGSSGDVIVAIQGTGSLANPGAPDDSDVLATQTLTESDLGNGYDNVETIAFSSPAWVEAGTTYAIVLSAPTCVPPEFGEAGFVWAQVPNDPYAGGESCFTFSIAPSEWRCGEDTDDFVFATYVTTTPPPPSADVRVTVSGPDSAPQGAQVTYLITVSNLGPDTAHNVVLTNPIPAGSRFVGISTTRGTCAKPSRGSISCSLGDLAKDDSGVSALSVKLTVKAGSTVTDLASASSTTNGAGAATADPDTSNNWTSLTTTVTGKPSH